MKTFLKFLANMVLPALVRILILTVRINTVNAPNFTNNRVYIFWHSKMLVGWWIFRFKKYSALVSRSKDGDLLTSLLEKWKYNVIRGSSSSGGKDAINEIVSSVGNGNSAVITPDGPRGPAHEIKNGALIISKECIVPITPVKINYSRKVVLTKSWDKFEIPFPFSKCEVHFGKQYFYREFLPEKELTEFKETLSGEM